MKSRNDPLDPRKGFTLVELLVVIAIIGVLLGLLLPAVQKVRESSNRVQCQNNLKQIALAALTYHDVYNGFPQALNNEANPPYDSPFVPLLPYLEQQPLYQLGNSTNPNFDYSTPDSAAATPVAVFVCPSDAGLPVPAVLQLPGASAYLAMTSYRGNQSGLSALDPNFGTDGVMMQDPAPPVKVVYITDGSSNTILFGEFNNFEPNWGPYADLAASTGLAFPYFFSAWSGNAIVPLCGSGFYPLNSMLPPNPPDLATGLLYVQARCYTFGSCHPSGANFAFCDGSVRFITDATANSPGILPALATRAGGETVDPSTF
jgi:prepilin-type N-terminal cleavage/methylation domain-containing protein/prepilin-type processing-associated H-X9-DG protein